MSIYRLELSYDGTDFFGWQKQPNVKTVQGSLEQAIKKTFKVDDLHTIGSGRTDAGVHARLQVVKLTIKLDVAEQTMLKAINRSLPNSIHVKSLIKSADFHPVKEAKKKVYRYYFSKKAIGPFGSRFITSVGGSVDVDKMRSAAKLFEGEHSFHNYFCVGTEVNSYMRTIFSCTIESKETVDRNGDLEDCYYLEVVGSGFLKQMIRLIFGTLHSVGKGDVSKAQILKSFELESKGKLAPVARPEGLILYNVIY